MFSSSVLFSIPAEISLQRHTKIVQSRKKSEMAPVPGNTANTIEHFTHPGHPLAEYNDAQEGYLCDGCKTPGIGKRYRCHSCNFDLHEYCGSCPPNLSIGFMHPHPLSLVVRKAQSTRQNNRICNVCRESVEGLFYRCKDCDFDLHPICTQLPESLTHVLHRVHPLKLEAPPSSNQCAFCGGVCNSRSWRYRCALCGFDMHLQCLLKSCEQSSQGQGTTTQRGRPPPPPPPHSHSYPFYHQSSPPFPSHGYNMHPQPQHVHGAGTAAAYAYSFPVSPMPYPMQMHHHGYSTPPQAGGSGGLGNIMFTLVKRIGLGVASQLLFGVDLDLF